MMLGNLTRNLPEDYIMFCPYCDDWCEGGWEDASYDDAFGMITNWARTGLCVDCGSEMREDEDCVEATARSAK